MHVTPSDGHRDRSGGLLVLGILEIIGGCLCLLFAGLMFLGLQMARARASVPSSPRTMFPSMSAYLGLAVILVWLGIGSVRARRWARALWVCVSGIGVVTGVMGLATLSTLLAGIRSSFAATNASLPPMALTIIEIGTTAFLVVFLVILPALLFAFYSGPHVRRTCELRDPVPRWTDRCPLPVLALSLYCLFLGWGVLLQLGLGGMYPWFGRYLTGASGIALDGVACAAWILIAWRVYRVQRDGWWAALALASVSVLSVAITTWRGEYGQVLIGAGLDARAAAMASRLAATPALRWAQLLHLVPFFLWMAWVRRYFRPSGPAPLTENSVPA